MKKKIYIILVVIGLLGTVCFFPMDINSTYTCLFHQYFFDGVHDHSLHVHNSSMEGMQSHNSPLLDYYIIRFGFLWWGSIAVFVLGLYAVRKKYKVSLLPQFQIWR
jgi:hypothetical protein